MEVKCEVCGKIFEKSKYRINKTKTGKHYCSRECYNLSPINKEKSGVELECKFCGSIIYRSMSYVKNSKSGNFFCSKQCSSMYLKKESDHNVLCSYCGKSFRKSPSTIKENNYCSRVCWREGVKSDNSITTHDQYKKDACEICSFIPDDPCQLDLHGDDHDDIKTLCANCHRLIHKRLREAESIENTEDIKI